MTSSHGSSQSGGIVVFSGGSAANSLVDVFNTLRETKRCALSYVIPISDNGGSSSELIRVLGGPGIGDLRSRLVRLIPSHTDPERQAIKAFFNHRLTCSSNEARIEWLDIVEARHPLWQGISSAKKELVRSFLNLLNSEIVKRARPSSVFDFRGASVGNMFLTGARLFSGSLEAGIYLLSSICGIPQTVSVLPAINTNFSHHIRAGLSNGETITGQNSISHPSDPTALPSSSSHFPALDDSAFHDPEPKSISTDGTHIPITSHTEALDSIEDANWPGSLPILRQQNITFSKARSASGDTDLPASIDRIWYINPYGQEIRPGPNPQIVKATKEAEVVIYSIGSLWTSLCPCLILRGVGEAISQGNRRRFAENPTTTSEQSERTGPESIMDARTKVLILNGSLDRETSGTTTGGPYTALDFLDAIARSCLESQGDFSHLRHQDPSSSTTAPSSRPLSSYVTHLIYMDRAGVPLVDRARLSGLGVECIKVYGKEMPDGSGWRYDEKALAQALIAVCGRHVGGDGGSGGRSRRNTLEV